MSSSTVMGVDDKWSKEELTLLKVREELRNQLNRLKIEEVAIRQKIANAEEEQQTTRNHSEVPEGVPPSVSPLPEFPELKMEPLDLDPSAMFNG